MSFRICWMGISFIATKARSHEVFFFVSKRFGSFYFATEKRSHEVFLVSLRLGGSYYLRPHHYLGLFIYLCKAEITDHKNGSYTIYSYNGCIP